MQTKIGIRFHNQFAKVVFLELSLQPESSPSEKVKPKPGNLSTILQKKPTDHLLFLCSDDIIRSLEPNGRLLNKSAILF